MTEHHHGDRSTCSVCGQEIIFWEYSVWSWRGLEVLDSWWSHIMHPNDNHDGVPDER